MPAALYETKFEFFLISESQQPENVETLGEVESLIDGYSDEDEDEEDMLENIQRVKSMLTNYQHDECWFAMAGSDYFGNKRPYDIEWLAGMCFEVCDDPYVCMGVIKDRKNAVALLKNLETLASNDYFAEDHSLRSVVQTVRDFLAHSVAECAIVFISGLD